MFMCLVIRASKCMRQKLIELHAEINKATVIGRDFNTSLLRTDRMNTQKIIKVEKT